MTSPLTTARYRRMVRDEFYIFPTNRLDYLHERRRLRQSATKTRVHAIRSRMPLNLPHHETARQRRDYVWWFRATCRRKAIRLGT